MDVSDAPGGIDPHSLNFQAPEHQTAAAQAVAGALGYTHIIYPTQPTIGVNVRNLTTFSGIDNRPSLEPSPLRSSFNKRIIESVG
jgi:hypothetical protein